MRRDNQFNLRRIIEVAVLFLGIFICMQPALQISECHRARAGHRYSVRNSFGQRAVSSSVLDNAPTYLVFFKAAQSMHAAAACSWSRASIRRFWQAISLGSVFMGAMTYIGNGPNFMVKAIAEQSGVRMPSFFGYMVYSFAILLPVFALTVWRFLM